MTRPPPDRTAPLILVGFVLPGFVAWTTHHRHWLGVGEESTFDRLLTAMVVAYSRRTAAEYALRVRERLGEDAVFNVQATDDRPSPATNVA